MAFIKTFARVLATTALVSAGSAGMAAGIMVILMNAGRAGKARELGAINYVGSDEYVAGVAGGEYFGDAGQKNVL